MVFSSLWRNGGQACTERSECEGFYPVLTSDLAVIGGGPAGYTAALRAARLGASVTLIEKSELGGACLNRACIPTKTILHSISILRDIRDAARFGIQSGEPAIDLSLLRERKNAVVDLMASGVRQLLDNSGVRVLQGAGRLVSPGELEIDSVDGKTQSLKVKKIIISTGSVSCRLNVPGADQCVYPRDVLELSGVPGSAVIIGGGAVGIEMASILNGLGCKVDNLEIAPRILPGEDEETVRVLERALKKDGIGIHTAAQVMSIEAAEGAKRIRFVCANADKTIEAEQVCVAIGQKPALQGLGLETCGVEIDRCGIVTDEHMRTSVPGIFAAGDATGKAMLAYVAEAQGRVAAANAVGMDSTMDYSAIPHCVYTQSLEIASVGLTEAEAASRGLKVKVLRSDLAANPAAAIRGERRGMVKLVVEAETGVLLGAHIASIDASSLTAECTLAVKMRMTVKDLRDTLHPHPSLSEAVWHAALNSDKR
jgi:dihydrolipoamide dehydrogenase